MSEARDFPTTTREGFEACLTLARDVTTALERLFEIVDGRHLTKPPIWRYHSLIAAFMARAHALLGALHVLCERGWASAAQPLLRSLFELVVSAVYMDQGDHAQLADRFVDYGVVPEFKFAEGLRDTDVGRKMLATSRGQSKVTAVARKRDAYRCKYGARDATWYGTDLCSLARQLGDEWVKLYCALYRPTSQYAHGNVRSLVQYVRHPDGGSEGESPRILYGPAAEGTEETLLPAIHLIFHLVNVWSKEVELESEADAALEPLIGRHTRLWEQWQRTAGP